MQKIITGDEIWCFQYDPKSKWQSLQWKYQTSSQPKKASFHVEITNEDNTHSSLS